MGNKRIDWPAVRLTEEQRRKAESVLRLAYGLVLKRVPRGTDEGTVYSLAGEACVRAAATHDPARGTMCTWVGQWVMQSTSSHLRLGARSVRAATFTDLQALTADRDEGGGDGWMIDTEGSPDAERAGSAELAERLLAQVPDPRDRRVIRLRLMDGLTLAETARALGLSRERVRQIQKRAERRLLVAAGLAVPPAPPEKTQRQLKAERKARLAVERAKPRPCAVCGATFVPGGSAKVRGRCESCRASERRSVR